MRYFVTMCRSVNTSVETTLHVAPSNMENKSSRQMLEVIRNDLLHNLSKLQHAPSVPFQERPLDTETPELHMYMRRPRRWDTDSDMDVDDDRYEGLKGVMERGKGFDVGMEESGSTKKVTGVNSVGMEDASVRYSVCYGMACLNDHETEIFRLL
ncbi:hypothetical protein Bca4012_086035 [Brassica carinata]